MDTCSCQAACSQRVFESRHDKSFFCLCSYNQVRAVVFSCNILFIGSFLFSHTISVCVSERLPNEVSVSKWSIAEPIVYVNRESPEDLWTEFVLFFAPPGGVILYAGSSGSASPSPGSPSSGYQSQSPCSHSQPSSPEGASFQEIGPPKLGGEQRGGTPSPKSVFQFPEVNNAPVAQITTVSSATYNHPTVAKRPCGFTGTFTSKYPLTSFLHVLNTCW